MARYDREKQVQKIMKLRGCDREEALQVVLDDEAVDRGEPLPWDLTPEQKKVQKQARATDQGPREKTTREKKQDTDKQELIQMFLSVLEPTATDINVLNQEREIEFKYNGRKFKITLSAPRK